MKKLILLSQFFIVSCAPTLYINSYKDLDLKPKSASVSVIPFDTINLENREIRHHLSRILSDIKWEINSDSPEYILYFTTDIDQIKTRNIEYLPSFSSASANIGPEKIYVSQTNLNPVIFDGIKNRKIIYFILFESKNIKKSKSDSSAKAIPNWQSTCTMDLTAYQENREAYLRGCLSYFNEAFSGEATPIYGSNGYNINEK